jgi:dihydroorotate dehydrogenase (NAD+) catalytic subunit
LARAAVAAGADALSLINTVLGLAIDHRTRRFIFDRTVAGLSGPAIKPIALRMVWEVAQEVAVPLIGMGGACSGPDLIEFLLAGATAVAFGTANFTNPLVVSEAFDYLKRYCKEQGITGLHELRGGAE